MENKTVKKNKQRMVELEEISKLDRNSVEKEISELVPSVLKSIKERKSNYINVSEVENIFYLGINQCKFLRLKLEAYENIEFKNNAFYQKKKYDKTQINELTEKMIDEYVKHVGQRNPSLRQRLTIEFVRGKSISEICKSNPGYSKNEILKHIITDKRLPAELKKMENEQYFDSDTKISLLIPLFAVDYFQWEGEKKDEQKVIDLAVEIKEHLTKKNRDVFHTPSTRGKITYQKVVKSNLLREIQLDRIKELISFKMYNLAHNMCMDELKISLDRKIIFCKIYCLIKLNKMADVKIECKYFINKLSNNFNNILFLTGTEYISDETGAKVNKMFWNI